MNVFKKKHDRDIEHSHQACTTNRPSTAGEYLAQSRCDITQLHFKKKSPVTFQTGQHQRAPLIEPSKRQSELHIPICMALMECSATKLCCLNQSPLENVWKGRVVVPYLYRCHSVRTSNGGSEWARRRLCKRRGEMAGTLVSKACQCC